MSGSPNLLLNAVVTTILLTFALSIASRLDQASKQLRLMAGEVDLMAGHTVKALAGDVIGEARKALEIEDRVNNLHTEMRQGYARRLHRSQAGVSSGLLFFDMVMNYEKMGDHYTDIAQAGLGELRWDKGVKAIPK